jgi:hypothetical protein
MTLAARPKTFEIRLRGALDDLASLREAVRKELDKVDEMARQIYQGIFAVDAAQNTTSSTYLPLAGGQMTGNITFSGTQTVDGVDVSAHAANTSNPHSVTAAQASALALADLPLCYFAFHELSSIAAGNALAYDNDPRQLHGITAFQSVAADGDTFTQTFLLKVGTYTFSFFGMTKNDCGKVDITLDGTSIATAQDWYSLAVARNVQKDVAAVVVAASTRHTLQVKVNGHNAGSSGYYVRLTYIAVK